MSVVELKNWMNENRVDFFKKYPQPNKTKARRVWKNSTAFLNNTFDGDLIGGESGHADADKTASDFLIQLKGMMD